MMAPVIFAASTPVGSHMSEVTAPLWLLSTADSRLYLHEGTASPSPPSPSRRSPLAASCASRGAVFQKITCEPQPVHHPLSLLWREPTGVERALCYRDRAGTAEWQINLPIRLWSVSLELPPASHTIDCALCGGERIKWHRMTHLAVVHAARDHLGFSRVEREGEDIKRRLQHVLRVNGI